MARAPRARPQTFARLCISSRNARRREADSSRRAACRRVFRISIAAASALGMRRLIERLGFRTPCLVQRRPRAFELRQHAGSLGDKVLERADRPHREEQCLRLAFASAAEAAQDFHDRGALAFEFAAPNGDVLSAVVAATQLPPAVDAPRDLEGGRVLADAVPVPPRALGSRPPRSPAARSDESLRPATRRASRASRPAPSAARRAAQASLPRPSARPDAAGQRAAAESPPPARGPRSAL